MMNLVATQFLALGAYALMRIMVGSVWLYLAVAHLRVRKEIATSLKHPFVPFPHLTVYLIIGTELLLGILFILGAATQLAAFIAFLWCSKLLLWRSLFSHPSFPTPMTLILLMVTSVSLFITGAGWWAFDLPV